MAPTPRRARPRAKAPKRVRWSKPEWVDLTDAELLEWRFCDLALTLEKTPIAARIDQLRDELRRKKLVFQPDIWISTDWFSPDGVPGIAVPFFVVHPRLRLLERRQMQWVEGGTNRAFMRLIRHEAGHAIDNAYRLHKRPDWREMFGRYSQPYRSYYHPKPYSKRFVVHLDNWYAQSHPAEDYAETFAVWLDPGSRWRKRYDEWPALEKLEYIDGLMNEVSQEPPLVRKRERPDSVASLRMRLGEYYQRKRSHYGKDRPVGYDRDLRRLFRERRPGERRLRAHRFLRSVQPQILRAVARWTGEFQYTVKQVLGELIERAEELDLVVASDERESLLDATIMLTIQTMNYVHSGYHRLLR